MTIRRQSRLCVPLTDFRESARMDRGVYPRARSPQTPFPLAAQETPMQDRPAKTTAALFTPIEVGPLEVPQPHRHGALDAEPRGGRQRAERAQRALLRPARKRRAHHLRSDAGRAGRPGLYLDARHPQRRADQRLAMRDRRGPCRRRPHGAPALACRAHLASVLPARRQAAGGAFGHQTGRAGLYRQRLRADPHATRARDRRDPRHRSAICARGAQCTRRRASTASRCMPRTVT